MVSRTIKKIKKAIRARAAFGKFEAMASDNSRFPLQNNTDTFFEEASETTDFDRHYVYHTAWAARVLARTRPQKHIDIASSLYFSSIASAFVPIEFYDIRPANLTLSNLTTGKADILHLPFANFSLPSLSCMHTVEHVGLGRYGDPMDPDGDLKAIRELIRVLAPGGNLLFVVPMGRPSIVFNAHRIYSYDQILSYFDELTLKEFFLIPDRGDPVINAPKTLSDSQSYGCGCFWFRK